MVGKVFEKKSAVSYRKCCLLQKVALPCIPSTDSAPGINPAGILLKAGTLLFRAFTVPTHSYLLPSKSCFCNVSGRIWTNIEEVLEKNLPDM